MKSTVDHRAIEDFAPDADPAAEEGLDIVGLVLKHKWRLLLGLICGLAVGQAAYVKLGPSYVGTARVLVSKKSSVPLRDAAETATFGERAEHVALIMSPLIVEGAVKNRQLDQLPSLAGNRLLGQKPDAVHDILGSLKVKRTSGSDQSYLNLFDIAYESRAPKDAPAVVAAIIESYAEYLDKTRDEETAHKIAMIKQANKELQRDLAAKEAAYMEFRREAPMQWRNLPGVQGQSGDLTNVHQDRVMAIEADRRANLLRRLEIQSKLKSLDEARERGDSHEQQELLVRRFLNFSLNSQQTQSTTNSALATVGGNSALVALETRFLPLFLQEKQLLRDYGPDHPDVKSVRGSIAALREFYRQHGVIIPDANEIGDVTKVIDLVDVYATSLRQELSELEYRDTELAAMFDKESKASKDFAYYQLEDQKLNGEVKRLKTLWETVVGRMDELNLLKDTGGYTMKVVAEPREELSLKRQLKIIGGGGMLGIVFAFGVAYLRTIRDTTFKNIDQVRQLRGIKVLGEIPVVDFKKQTAAEDSTLDSGLFYIHNSNASAAEACRSVRSALLVATQQVDAKLIQITSPEAKDGKSLLTANLAASLARSGRRVLLIDADLRQPSAYALFGLSGQVGLSDVLTGELDLTSAIHTTEVDGLSVIGSGVSPANPAEMLSSRRFEQLLHDVRNQFDFVLVDTPPVLSVSDPCVIAAHTDAVLLVLRLGKSGRDVTQRAQQTLATHGAKLLGVVANCGEAPSVVGTERPKASRKIAEKAPRGKTPVDAPVTADVPVTSA